MKTLSTTFTAFLFAAFLTLAGCSAGALTGPGQPGQEQGAAPVQTATPNTPDGYNAPIHLQEGDTNGGGSTDQPDIYNLGGSDD